MVSDKKESVWRKKKDERKEEVEVEEVGWVN